ncbi:MAG TPA: ABC transporter ATP-binding protein [Candidatus Methylomirabilis sp.]|nr:ABC transporter ATP-binding protein [Candidatus Methylomirabilis sp.]HSC72078.1 ABC transporter ATP-binding protein [Candidatus Methylomirabilis sp.]
MLRVDNLDVSYGDVRVLHGVSLTVGEGEIVSLVGANGAGKSTTLKTISGLLRPEGGDVTFMGEALTRLSVATIVARGLSQVPEGRQLFTLLSVRENLELGAFTPKARGTVGQSMGEVFALFPRLEERQDQVVGTLSGGEQQMVAIGRALMAVPRLLMLDEPSLGLDPLQVRTIFRTITRINSEGRSILLVEQNLVMALGISHRAYVLENGRVVLEGTGESLLRDERTKRAFLGM